MIVSDQVQAGIVAQQLKGAFQEQCASSVLSSAYLQEGNWFMEYFKTLQGIFFKDRSLSSNRLLSLTPKNLPV